VNSSLFLLADKHIKRHKSEINAAIKKTILEGVGNFIRSFEIEIKSGSPDTERQYRFAIHHRIQNYPENESLRSWSKDEALVPWVAVASEIGVSLWRNHSKA
jgi:sacsin